MRIHVICTLLLITWCHVVYCEKKSRCDCSRTFDAKKDCAGLSSKRFLGLFNILPDPCDCSCYYVCDIGLSSDDSGTWRATRNCCGRCRKLDTEKIICMADDSCDLNDSNDSSERVEDISTKKDYTSALRRLERKNDANCPLRAVPAEPDKYTLEGQEKQCRKNTTFDVKVCACVPKNLLHVRKEITCLTFDDGFIGLFGESTSHVNVALVDAEHDVTCPSGACAYFDGRARIQIPRFANVFDSWKQFALSLWYRQADSTDDLQILVGDGCAFLSSLSVMTDHGSIVASLANNTGHNAYGGVIAADNTWHHLVISWDGDHMQTFLNGKLVHTSPLTGRLYGSACALVLGAAPEGEERAYRGFMDQVCFYRRSLSAAEIQYLSKNPSITKL